MYYIVMESISLNDFLVSIQKLYNEVNIKCNRDFTRNSEIIYNILNNDLKQHLKQFNNDAIDFFYFIMYCEYMIFGTPNEKRPIHEKDIKPYFNMIYNEIKNVYEMQNLNTSELLCIVWERISKKEKQNITDNKGWVDWWKTHNKYNKTELLKMLKNYK